jgi:hypothetical protein
VIVVRFVFGKFVLNLWFLFVWVFGLLFFGW